VTAQWLAWGELSGRRFPYIVRVFLRQLSAALVLVAGCSRSAPTPASPAPEPERHPLAGIVGQNIVVAPFQALRVPAVIGWPAMPASRPLLAGLDSLLADTLRSRVGNQEWVFADALVRAAANNPTYATDPRALAVNPLRSPGLKVSDRLPEPLASQLRTMIALQDARLVLIPVDMTIDRISAGIGRAVVRVVLVDPRSSVVRWIGQVTGPDSPAFTPEISASIAARFADLFVAK
jgi:hypothetical protein